MDPSSFTNTSFCGVQVDNITENEAKEYILNQMTIRCEGISYNHRYAKVYNDQYKKNLNNPHILCLKSSGTPYLLFLTQINETNYSFLIDKRVKDGYTYPKIFILPYHWSPELYEGTLFECELLRDRHQNWSLAIGDIYFSKGTSMSNIIIMDRVSAIHDILEKDFHQSCFCETCCPFVKRYFDYREFGEIVSSFVPSLTYDIRGVYFIPLKCSYSKIIYLLPRDNPMNLPTEKGPRGNHNAKKKEGRISRPISKDKGQMMRLMKTMKPDVYEVYSVDQGTLRKQGIALVQTTQCSDMLWNSFQGKSQSDEVWIECIYDKTFSKWTPLIS